MQRLVLHPPIAATVDIYEAVPGEDEEYPEGTPNLRPQELHRVLGTQRILKISEEFYTRVWNDKAPERASFRYLFQQDTTLEQAISSQQSYFVQRFGGDPLHGGLAKNTALLRKIHTQFRIVPRYVNDWLTL